MAQRHQMLSAEWRHIKTHRILLVSLVVMLIIPIMYGGFFLGSMWDPYGNTQHLPVAIVNQDEGAELNGKSVRVGDDLVESLKKNEGMGWEFVSAEQATTGIADGSYYMRLVIPADFSRNVATVTSSNPSKSVLEYTTTPARNYVASLLTTQAAQQIRQTVATKVSAAYVEAILTNVSVLGDGLTDAANGAQQLTEGTMALSQGTSRYVDGVARVQSGQASLGEGISRLNNGADSLKDGLMALHDGVPTTSQIQALVQGVQGIESGVVALDGAVSTPSPELVARQQEAAQAATLLQSALVEYGAASTAAQASVTDLTTAVERGDTTVVMTGEDAAKVLRVVAASQVVAQRSTTVLTSVSSLTTTLTAQQAQLVANVGRLKSGVTQLSPRLTTALNGYTAIANGSSRLLTGANALSAGSIAVQSGNVQLQDGLDTLVASSQQLTAGVTQLGGGASTLRDGLKDAARRLSLQPTTEATTEHIVAPVDLTAAAQGNVPNYGYALSPYVLSLGLFVGALAFNMIYPIRRTFDAPKSARSWWAAKLSVAFSVAVGQAIVLDVLMMTLLGLRPDHIGLFMLVSMVTSLTYMSIVTFLVLLLDNVGRFLSMVLLVLQLAASGGVFPLVLSSGFFQALGPLMPMTYSIRAYRESISSGLGLALYWQSVLILLAIGVIANLLILLFFRLHGMRRFAHESVDD